MCWNTPPENNDGLRIRFAWMTADFLADLAVEAEKVSGVILKVIFSQFAAYARPNA